MVTSAELTSAMEFEELSRSNLSSSRLADDALSEDKPVDFKLGHYLQPVLLDPPKHCGLPSSTDIGGGTMLMKVTRARVNVLVLCMLSYPCEVCDGRAEAGPAP